LGCDGVTQGCELIGDAVFLWLELMITFSNKRFSWKNTIYVLGLPRSGKSTIYNLIASCRDTEGVDEPFELQIMAQKGGAHAPSSPQFRSYSDAYLAMMENYFSELVLGRRYNFRCIDNSYIMNIKSKSDVEVGMNRRGRADVIKYSSGVNASFVVSFNNVEDDLVFITHEVPSPKIIYVRRNIEDVSADIGAKNWFSDDNLSSQYNIGIPFDIVVSGGKEELHIPYLIPDSLVSDFVRADDFGRADIYCRAQAARFEAAVKAARVDCLCIDFETLLEDPAKVAAECFHFGGLDAGDMTPKLLSDLEARRIGG
jgi:hypothetical protein